MTWITHNVIPSIASHLCFYPTAKQMWESLNITYSGTKNLSKIFQAEQEIFNLKQGDLSLAQYFSEVKRAYQKLNALRPPCTTCRESHHEKTMVTRFLSGLSSRYESEVNQMLTSIELPTLEEAYCRMSKLVLSIQNVQTDTTSSASLAIGGRGRG
ncbi:hypothetical protein QML37_31295, partial [Klebsiella pneumoniae]|uniref:hypothetical protein n=1 Tax=Klebsiella pneumoniae TaxID=573 RepID=UPI003A80CC89